MRSRASFTKKYKLRERYGNRLRLTNLRSSTKDQGAALKFSTNSKWNIFEQAQQRQRNTEREERQSIVQPRHHQQVQGRLLEGGCCFHIGMSCTESTTTSQLFYVPSSQTDVSVLNWLDTTVLLHNKIHSSYYKETY